MIEKDKFFVLREVSLSKKVYSQLVSHGVKYIAVFGVNEMVDSKVELIVDLLFIPFQILNLVWIINRLFIFGDSKRQGAGFLFHNLTPNS